MPQKPRKIKVESSIVLKWLELIEERLSGVTEAVKWREDGMEENIEDQINSLLNEDIQLMKSQLIPSKEECKIVRIKRPVQYDFHRISWSILLRTLKSLNNTELYSEPRNVILDIVQKERNIKQSTLLVMEEMLQSYTFERAIELRKNESGQLSIIDEIESSYLK